MWLFILQEKQKVNLEHKKKKREEAFIPPEEKAPVAKKQKTGAKKSYLGVRLLLNQVFIRVILAKYFIIKNDWMFEILQGIFFPSLGAEFRISAPFPKENSHVFSQ